MSYVIKTEVDINAGPEAVWGVLVDFPRYGEWSNFSRVEGKAQVGNRLSMKMPGLGLHRYLRKATAGSGAWRGQTVPDFTVKQWTTSDVAA